MGFGRIDRLAREIAARKQGSGSGAPSPAPRRGSRRSTPAPRPASRRSTPRRWATLMLLAAAGAGGAIYFVAGASGTKPPDLRTPRVPTEMAQRAGEPAPEPEAPAEPAPSLELSAAGASAARAAQIAVVLDDVDATLHGLRLTWPGQMGSLRWPPPTWLTAERLERELAALDSQLAGASDPLSLATRAWIAVAREDGARLYALHAAWSAPGASSDAIAVELRPIFDRLVAASQAVHAAVAASSAAPPPGTLAALASACRVAPLLARLPLRGAAAGPPIVEQGEATPSPPPMSEQPEPELRAHATACLDEARAFLAAHPGAALDHDDIYRLGLANQIALNLLREADRRRKPPATRVFVSTAANLAQASSFLATARRRHDPTLRAEAEPVSVPAGAPPR